MIGIATSQPELSWLSANCSIRRGIPKWQEVNLAAQLPGWTRFRPAQEWLDQRTTPGSAGYDLALNRSFEEFLRFVNEIGERRGQSASLLSREALFARFLDWRNQQQARGASGVTGPIPPPAAAAPR